MIAVSIVSRLYIHTYVGNRIDNVLVCLRAPMMVSRSDIMCISGSLFHSSCHISNKPTLPDIVYNCYLNPLSVSARNTCMDNQYSLFYVIADQFSR
jgi:hypothetical protein